MLNDAKNDGIDFLAVVSRNYEIFHIVESKIKTEFGNYSLYNSIAGWNNEMIEYSISIYDFDFLEKSEVSNKPKNFSFFESIFFFQFLRNNPSFIERNIHEIIMSTFSDNSCFFTKAFLNFPNIDINYHSPANNERNFLSKAIVLKNTNAIKLLFKK